MRALGNPPHARTLAFFLTALYALSDEFHQAFVPGRDTSLLDVGCDLVGAGLGLWVHARFKRRSQALPRRIPSTHMTGLGLGPWQVSLSGGGYSKVGHRLECRARLRDDPGPDAR